MKLVPNFLKVLPLLSLFSIMMIGSSWHIAGFPLMPTLLLIPVYYWLVYHPSWLPQEGLFVIGLVYDVLMGHALGVSSILLMGSTIVGRYSRSSLRPDKFLLIWLGFVFFSGGYLLLYALCFSGGIELFVSWIFGVILYPLVVLFLSHLHLWIQSHV
ncbi:MAG: hypothetical protein ACD_16C00235G0018 [uncultured bacterium]|nr:MAG: hypothetical protein ACD_16C00235G0018 [uncultured bacterium]OFW69961.1 MAG: hypothetical protein A2X70_00105 [Alphaproteobacteria bacterium GWC2_42_16]OFW74440.1 MAG: hypothetical protein A2Z80_05370 [Alphaproteobacteria bacterium GWA2_41_27]OFW84793.1 MAG: hypothetical protein A3E50_00830 [Alphaproteobacteria bacterium RIFCSPHIGHO2_12_FULL_42_100]OFW86656.1 MAG: hypothetical protein A2W06_04610 [Alphaproteobacteria bacterium RBG_16_42_14]OFW90668.1 MAG: hypothetical protein A3C41_046